MLSGAEPNYQRYRAPRGNNLALVAPPIDELQAAPPCASIGLRFGDLSLAELRKKARDELLAAATSYTTSYRNLPELPQQPSPLYLTGHQAELFHPGVWFKNFMLSRLATERGAVGIHLVIDTDVMHHTSIRVPTGTVVAPRAEAVPLDRPVPVVPVEEQFVSDRAMFVSFGERVQQSIAPLLTNPLVTCWWPSVVEAARESGGKLGLAIAQARHCLEDEWSAATLEVPMSHCCNLDSFRHFSAALLLDSERVREAYNQALAAYRHAHHLRSDAQPMPNLAADDDWIETPFWMWTAERPTRQPLFARVHSTELALSNHQDWQAEVELNSGDSHRITIQWLDDLAHSGVKIRTRALTTTLFARLVLSDLFLHGIGGAKYDEVTDDLAQRLWGCPPPPYATLSATLQLPIEHTSVDDSDLHRIRRQLRECQWHPERWLENKVSPAAAKALTSKRSWIETPKTPKNATARHQSIEAANVALRAAVATERARLEADEQRLVGAARASAVLESREYAFCLFPEDDLRRRMWQLVENA